MDEQQRRLAEELLFTGVKKPSFGKMLYFGILNTEDIFPFPSVSLQEKKKVDILIAEFNAFADRNLHPDEIDRTATIPQEVIDGLGRLGILGMTVPEEYGGLGMSQYAYCKVAEEVARRCAATALFLNAHQSIGLKALLLFGTDAQRNRWLPPLAKGEQIAAFSLTEPNAGSDANGVETRAVFIPEKDIYIINGRKQWTTNGSIASVLTVMARTEIETPKGKEDKITAFLVTPDMPGFRVTASSLEKMGMRGSKTANLEFVDMEVPAANILGPLGGGLKVCLTVLDYGRTTFGATCTGAAKTLLNKAIDHAKNRRQFKRPLASFELVKKKLAVGQALVYAMEATTYMTAGLVDNKVEDFMLEAAILKVFTSEALWRVLYDTMQIYGGRSFFTDEPLERMMRDARLNMIGEGSNEVMRAFIGVVGMRDVGIYLKGGLEALKNPVGEWSSLVDFGKQWMRRFWKPALPVRSKLLFIEAQELGNAVRRFGFEVTKLLAKHREAILEKQLLLDRIADSAIALYTAAAVLSKLDSALEKVHGRTDELGADLAAGKLYCKMAFETIDVSLSGLWNHFDDDIVTLADKLTGLRRS